MHALMIAAAVYNDDLDERCGIDYDYYEGIETSERFKDVTIGGKPLSEVKTLGFLKDHLEECVQKFTLLMVGGSVIKNYPDYQNGKGFILDSETMKRLWQNELSTLHDDECKVAVYDVHI